MHFSLDNARRLVLRSVLILAVAGLAAGCGIFSPDESTDGGGGGGGDPYPLATEPTIAIDNLERAYSELLFEEYEKLIADDFQFWFAPDDIDFSPGGQGFFNAGQDLLSTRAMFNGEVGERPDPENPGSTIEVPPVQKITINLTRTEPWSNAGDFLQEYDGMWQALYDVEMLVEYTAGDLVSEVNAEQRFIVKPVTIEVDGAQTQVYQLRAWYDLARPLGKELADAS